MIRFMKMFWQCFFSPRLYKIYRDGPLDTLYQPQGGEKWGDKIITSANALLQITLYTSPLIYLYIYKRGSFTFDEYKSMARYAGGVSCFLGIALMMRAYGRVINPKYMTFLKTLKGDPNKQPDVYISGIQKYDFDFAAWPISYKLSPESRSLLPKNPFETTANSHLPLYQRVVIQTLAFIATHTFALRLIYPGSLSLVHKLLWVPIIHGRTHLVESYNGQRAKLKTSDDNIIDTMFVDNRNSNSTGGTLVICCEGNSGFYEVGIMTSPIKAGYSALGWNHPGFAESTGQPYPSQEHNAIDAVMMYAINKLKFDPENIVMFGWSIGGYSAAWAATNYPVKGVILDATFDDLLPLALNLMPESWTVLVQEVIRSYVNLHVAEVLKKYSGPIQLVRRTEDEIICLRPGNFSSNRGNNLLVDLIRQRHPEVEDQLSQLMRYTTMPASDLPRPDTVAPEHAYVLEHIHRYTRDYKSSHCTPLYNGIFEDLMNRLLSMKN